MDGELDRFTELVRQEWLPSFCNARETDFQPEGFVPNSLERITAFDAHWFLRAVGTGLVRENGGFFAAPRSSVNEQIFWSGKRGDELRRLFLWSEPVITIGACARLCEEFGWPAEDIGTQSEYPWPFDLICYSADSAQEIVACEVKKSSAEIEKLLGYMHSYCCTDALRDEPTNPTERNAYRKIRGIRKSWPRFFWALGPDGAGQAFEISQSYGPEHFSMDPVEEQTLNFRNQSQG